MKTGIHPEYVKTHVRCNGCGIEFETHSTVPEITVEICSNCHPFYTGKQKLVDTAGRVDKFKARQEAAIKMKSSKTATKPVEEKMDDIKDELEENTVDLPETEGEEGEDEAAKEMDGGEEHEDKEDQ